MTGARPAFLLAPGAGAPSSHPRMQDHLDVCRETLAEFGAGAVPSLLVLNKCDLPGAAEAVEHAAERVPHAIPVSAHSGLGLDTLRLAIVEAAEGD